MKVAYHRNQLFPHERLRLIRRRLGKTQEQFGQQFGLDRKKYMLAERGESFIKFDMPPWVGVDFLTNAEACYIARYRCNLDQSKVAQEVGMSRAWVATIERGKSTEKAENRLLRYWLSR